MQENRVKTRGPGDGSEECDSAERRLTQMVQAAILGKAAYGLRLLLAQEAQEAGEQIRTGSAGSHSTSDSSRLPDCPRRRLRPLHLNGKKFRPTQTRGRHSTGGNAVPFPGCFQAEKSFETCRPDRFLPVAAGGRHEFCYVELRATLSYRFSVVDDIFPDYRTLRDSCHRQSIGSHTKLSTVPGCHVAKLHTASALQLNRLFR